MKPLTHFLITQNLSPIIFNTLENRWNKLSIEIDLPDSKRIEYFNLFQKHYSEQHRTYHNLSHLHSLFVLKDQLLEAIEDEIVIDLSIWFHDIVYKATRKDNEAKSAALFLELMLPYLPKATVETIHTYIVSTAKHEPLKSHLDNQIFLDLDLAILAAEKKIYWTYTKAIRQEYRIFPKLLYQAGRKKVMQRFLDRKHIYFSPNFKSLEPIAKANIQNEILNF